jgi:hypothetical protein
MHKAHGRLTAVLIAVLLLGAAVAVPAQATGGHASTTLQFGGRTSQCPPTAGRCAQVVFLLSRNMHKVKQFAIEYAATCQSNPGDPILDGIGTDTLPIKPRGRTYAFDASGTYDLDPDPTTGNTRHAAVTFTARVGRHGHARGTFKATITVTNAAGQQVDSCSTGATPVTWTARLHKS